MKKLLSFLKNHIFVLGLTLLISSLLRLVHAQVVTQRFTPGVQSAAWFSPKDSIPTLLVKPTDVDALLKEDAQQAKGLRPYRFGTKMAVDINLRSSASMTLLPTYRSYRYQIHSPGAYSINLIFDQFQLAAGAELYLYNATLSMQIGPITQQNSSSGEFWSDLIQGDRLILELREPLAAPSTSQIHIRHVIHGYKNVFSNVIGESGNCEVNMVCHPDYQFEGDGVVIILTQGGVSYCSGSILNDSRQSFRSFLLSANHCGIGANDLIRFKFQSPTCTPNGSPTQTITMNGSDFRSTYATSDFSLHELKRQIPTEANVTYLGWNRQDQNASNSFGIHHPEGDLKKISFSIAPTQIRTWSGGPPNTHLFVIWNNAGVTEIGSSGSPLLDGNRRVVGQLHGGSSDCGATGEGRSDLYGRFYTSWTGGGSAASRLSDWLDPTNVGASVTNGVKPVVDGPSTFTANGTFSLNTQNASIVSWSVAGGAGALTTTSGSGNVANLVATSSANSLTITFSVNAGQSYPIQFRKVFNVVAVCSLNAGLVNSGPLSCTNSVVTLTALGGSTGATYQFSSGATQAGGPLSNTATATTSGLYSVTISSGAGCSATASTTVSANQATPSISITASRTLLTCTNPSATLTAIGNGTYQWSTGATSSTISVTSAGTYSVTLTASNGCQSFTSIAIGSNTAAELFTVKAGVWSDPTVWSCGVVPGAGSVATIDHSVSLPVNYVAQLQRLRYGLSGRLIYTTGARLVLNP